MEPGSGAYAGAMSTPDDPYRSGPAEPPRWDTPSSGPSNSPAPGYGPPPQGYPPQGYGGYQGAQQTSSRAIIALVLAIGSFVVFPLIPAIIALVLASGARDEIDGSGGRVTGDGLVTAAKVVAWINIGLSVAGVLFAIAAFALFASVGFS
jgi:hypothetical protein